MTTTFRVSSPRPTTGRLVYNSKDFAFATLPRPSGCASSVSVNELELMLDDESLRVVYVWGYCPHPGWRAGALHVPPTTRGSLVAMLDREPIPGVTISLNDSRWAVVCDPGTGWVRLGHGDHSSDAAGIEFAPGAVAVLNQGELVALWLHPDGFPAVTG